ncbi:ABC transporter permease [Gynurincola endophyticus]|uniref:ABC transporter permease n=1 Tax=Gynurincola endophyticus TaxID=2479004 RepID=UPI000F8D0D38|nr:ABC transporter permease [Gynurincola endophyticus]
MSNQYSQLKAMLAITKASFRGLVRSPNTLVFNFLFPVVFIAIFSVLEHKQPMKWKVSFTENSDSTAVIYHALKNLSVLEWEQLTPTEQQESLKRGKIKALVDIQSPANAPSEIHLTTSSIISDQEVSTLQLMIETAIHQIDRTVYPDQITTASLSPQVELIQGKPYRLIDFLLPGQIGVTLLASCVFGVAFLFYNMRSTLVLKRFFATPVKRLYILLGEALSRVVLQLGVMFILIAGAYYFLNYTLTNGVSSLLQMLIVGFLGVILFMGFGFIISGIAKSESVIPPLANVIALPQFIFSGAFVNNEIFPQWIQTICEVLPLTQMNSALRKIAYDGVPLWSCTKELVILGAWLILVYWLATKLFKWE